jgi:hypothetical protein
MGIDQYCSRNPWNRERKPALSIPMQMSLTAEEYSKKMFFFDQSDEST